MGPQFKILVRIQNAGALTGAMLEAGWSPDTQRDVAGAAALYDVPVHCTTNQNLYRIPRRLLAIQLLLVRLLLRALPLSTHDLQQKRLVVAGLASFCLSWYPNRSRSIDQSSISLVSLI